MKSKTGWSSPLAGKINYSFVGDKGQTDDEGRLLVWEATIEGDLTGTMRWWFGSSPTPRLEYK